MWELDGFWYCARPDGHDRCPAPHRLNTTVTPAKDIPFANYLGYALVTPDQLKANRDFRDAYDARAPYETSLVNNGRGQMTISSEGVITLGPPIDQAGYDSLADEVAERMLPFFKWVGRAWVTLTGIVITASVLKVIVNCIARTIVLYQERGCGPWMLLALWNTAFTIARLPYAMWKTALDSVQNNAPFQNPREQDTVGPVSYRELLVRLEQERELLAAEAAENPTQGASGATAPTEASTRTTNANSDAADAAATADAVTIAAARAWENALAATRAGGTLPTMRGRPPLPF